MSTCDLQNKTSVEPTLTYRLEEVKKVMIKMAESLGRTQMNCGLDVVPLEFVRETMKFGMVEVVYEWARGVPFRHICELTDVAEGTVVRVITRLDETCREVRNAARIIGDPDLYRKSK